MTLFEYIGVLLVMIGQWARTDPKYLILSFVLSAIGSISLFLYSLYTQQWGYLVLNIFATWMSIKGYLKWKHVTTKEEE